MQTLKARRWILATLAFFPMLLAASAQGKIASELARSSLGTAHFRIHYPPHYQAFAEALADRLENIYLVLGPAGVRKVRSLGAGS